LLRCGGGLGVSKAGLLTLVVVLGGCGSGEPPPLGRFDYPIPLAAKACPTGAVSGDPGVADGISTTSGIQFNVRTPANYHGNYAHPLLVVFSPAGFSARTTEDFTGLTTAATAAGFIIAYVNSYPLNVELIPRMAEVPKAVSERWCVNARRIYFTGHSAGGTIASALAFLPQSHGLAAGIAPSSAGVRGSDMQAYQCPPPLKVLIFHGAKDHLFPGYGREMASWWARCNGCEAQASSSVGSGCIEYHGCRQGGETIYCEGDHGHMQWPDRNMQLLKFFADSPHG